MDKSKIKQPNKNQQQDKTIKHFGKEILIKKGEKKHSAFDEEIEQTDLPTVEKPVVLEEIDLDIEPLDLIPKPKNNRYSIEHKIQALSFLFGSLQQTTDRDGNPGLTPSFASVGLLTGIPANTLKVWWRQRAELEKTAANVKENLSSFVSMKLLLAVNGAVDALMEKIRDEGFKKSSISDLMKIIKDGAFQSRVLGNLSTANVAHAHKHKIEDHFEHPEPLVE